MKSYERTLAAAFLTGLVLSATAAHADPQIITEPASTIVTVGQTAYFTVNATGNGSLIYTWYDVTSGTPVVVSSSYNPNLALNTFSPGVWYYEVEVDDDDGTVFSVQVSLTVVAAGSPPTISTQPVNVTITLGQIATFSVVAAGTGPFSYTWYDITTGVPVMVGTFAPTLQLTPTMTEMRTYEVLVSNAYGSVMSNAVSLTVDAPTGPTILSDPVSETILLGQTATLSVVAIGSGTLTYTWFDVTSGSPVTIPGAVNSTFSITPSNVGVFMYEVQVSDANGSVINGPAVVTVVQSGGAPIITAQPVSVVIDVGQSATFSVSASGSAPLSYTWLDVTNATIPVPNGSGATLTIVPTMPMARVYRVQVSNTFGSVMSRSVTLGVLPAPPVVQPDGSTTPPPGPRPAPLVIVSPASAIPSPANVQQQISFTVSTVETSGATVTYSWDFGDGSTGSGSALFHSYAAAGSYLATVTASSPYGSIASRVLVTIQPPLSMTITQLIESSGRGGTIIAASGVIPNVPTGFNPSGMAAIISVGTESHAFMLSSRGTAKDSSGTFKLAFKRSANKKAKTGGTMTFSANFISTADNSVGSTLPVVLSLGNNAYAASAMLTSHHKSKH